MLDRLLRPRSLAFVGGRAAETALAQTQRFGFEGEVALVHPTRQSSPDRVVHPSIADLPFVPDAALVAVNREATLQVVGELASIGCGVAVCHASGYAEVGDDGAAMSDALLGAAGDMAIVGPNCYGTVNGVVGAALWPDEHGVERCERGVAFVTQSGNMAVNLTMQRRGMDVAHVLTLGNQIDVGIEACVEALVDDPAVTAIALHIEALTDVDRLAVAAIEAHRRRIPIVALKTGITAKGATIAASHTSSLVGDDDAYSALFEALGIRRVRSVPELLDTTHVLASLGPLEGDRLVSMSCSGGEASLVADLAGDLEVRFEDFEPEHGARVAATLNEFVAITNPLDYHTFIWGDRERLERCFSEVVGGPFDAAMLVLDFPKPSLDATSWWPTFDAFAAACASNGRKGLVVASMAENLPLEVSTRASEVGLVAVADVELALRSLEAAAWMGRVEPRLPVTRPVAPATEVLLESAAKDLLSDHGIPTPVRVRCSRADAVSAARDVGHPVVLKRADLEHKSDVGGVVIGIENDAGVLEALDTLGGSGDVLVEEQISGPVAELLVAVRSDETCGLLLTLGSGGTLVELLNDTCTTTLPVEQVEIEAMIRQLAAHALIDGHRGGPQGDLDAAVNAIAAICDAAIADESIVEIEVNPLIVTNNGATVADALITRGTP